MPSGIQRETTTTRSADPAIALREQLRGLVPEAFDGDVLDVERLATLLGDLHSESDSPDRYVFSWSGQRDAIRAAREPSTMGLHLVEEQSREAAATQNAYLQADNLEALKLLGPAYAGRVKCIYIDPPYNTGSDRLYRDDFSDTSAAYKRQTGQADASGIAMVANPETSGRFHSAWLTMMFPRLWWARKMLSDDGVIFVSIDDDEVHHLRLLMDMIFRQENHIANFVWAKKKKGSHLSKSHRSMTEYVVAYAKEKTNVADLYGERAYQNKAQPLVKRTNKPKALTFEEGTVTTTLEDGHYAAGTYGTGTTSLEFSAFIVEAGIVATNLTAVGPFVWQQSKLDEEVALGSQVTLSRQFGLNVFRHDEATKFKRPTTMLGAAAGVGTNEDANAECTKLLGEGVAEYPKPTSLIHYLVRAATYFHPDAIVMDLFAGSGTTGQAVWSVNRELGGARRFVLVQLPEPIGESNNAYAAGFRSLVELPVARLTRAAENEFAELAGELDLGFRTFRLEDSVIAAPDMPMRGPDTDPGEALQLLEQGIDPLRRGWEAQQLLWEVALAHGYPLNSKIQIREHGPNTLYEVTPPQGWELGPMYACLDDEVAEATVAYVVGDAAHIEMFVCRDVALDDTGAANLSLNVALRTI